MKKRKGEQYHDQKIKPLAKIVAQICKNNPRAMEDEQYLWSILVRALPELQKRKECVNCGASMREYIYQFDIHDALLLKGMGDEVRRKVDNGMDFTQANVIHVQKLKDVSYTAKSRTTQSRCLGLVAKHMTKKDTQNGWSVTRRGFKALRGEPVQKYVTVFRNEIVERSDAEITISEIFTRHRKEVKETLSRGKDPRGDYRDLINDYDSSEWYEFGDYHETKLI